MFVGRSAVQIPDLVAIGDGQGACDGLALIEGHIEPGMLAQIVQHVGKIALVAGDKAVAQTGLQHDAGEVRHHLLAADAHLHALFLGQADVVTPLLVERGHDLLLVSAVQIQTEHELGLDGLEVLAALLDTESIGAHERGKGPVLHIDIRIDLDEIGVIFLGKCPHTVQKISERLLVAGIAHRRAAAIHQGKRHAARQTADQYRHGTANNACCVPAYHGLPLPHGLLFGPQQALAEVTIGACLVEGLIFCIHRRGNAF